MTRKQPQRMYSSFFPNGATDVDEQVREGFFQLLFLIAKFIKNKNIEPPEEITFYVETVLSDQRLVAILKGDTPHED